MVVRRVAFVVVLLTAPALLGCSTSSAVEGVETGPCLAGQCLGDLECVANVCIPLDDDDDNDDDDGDPTGGLPATSGSTTADPSATAASVTVSSGSTSSDTTGAPSSATESADSSTSDWTTYGSTSGDPSGVGFILDPDVSPAIECSTWDQDCPAGEKCNAWANDGGNSWNATGCFDIAGSPSGVGESCTVQASGVSGVDDCVEGAICWGVDIETNVGECAAFCAGSEFAPECPAGTDCVISNNGVLPLCRTMCDPLQQLCGAGEGCYPIADMFVCSPDASGASGIYGDPCEYINGCDPGLACVDDDAVPFCGALGCCSPFCDLDTDVCPAGLDCVGAFEDGQAPPGLEDVGYCVAL